MSTLPVAVNPPSTSPQNSVPADVPRASRESTLENLGVYSPTSLDEACARDGEIPFVVEGIIKRGSIGIAVGDSGLGKSPLLYHLALCVAAGVPWLGKPTSSGPVLYIDCENGLEASRSLRDSLLRHLGRTECPNNFHIREAGWDLPALTRAILAIKPKLAVLDTLRSFDPSAEENNTKAGAFLNNLRRLTQHCGTSFLLIHHIKKPNERGFLGGGRCNLQSTPSIEWLNQACGARALINQTDFRIAIDKSNTGTASLVLRWNMRILGECGPWFLTRVFDEEQNPIGFRRLSGVEYLENKEQQEAFEKLPATFAFKEAMATYGRQDQATADFLKKCIGHGLLTKVGKGRYEKVGPRGTGVSGA